jgi:glutathione S-transferase
VAGLFSGDQEWARLKLPIAEEAVRVRLQRLSEWLGDKDYLEDRFTAGDLVMCAVLQILRNAPLLKEFPSLSAYLARCEARTAFQRAHAAQMAAFTD